jgi:predicted nucleotidyltransferase
MSPHRVVAMTEARRSWNRLISEVVDSDIPAVLTRYGKPVAMLCPYDHHQYPVHSARPSSRLTRDVRAQLLRKFDEYGATDVRVFGSVARGTDAPGSDIDFVAKFPGDSNLLRMFDLQAELEVILEVPVDVVSDGPGGGRALQAIRDAAVPFFATPTPSAEGLQP